jgi:hypothetical protein
MRRMTNMQVLMGINSWANRCGYFYNACIEKDITINNGYNCRHPECEYTDKGIGCCYTWSCPLGYEADRVDCKNVGLDHEESAYIIVDISEEDYCANSMWIRQIRPKREIKSKIKIELFVNSNEEFEEFKEDIYNGLDSTLAIISNDEKKYELYAEDCTLFKCTIEKNENGEFETTDIKNVFDFLDDVEELEGFTAKLIKLFL